MNLGRYKFTILLFAFILSSNSYILAEDKIQSVPLVNLEDLSPTFEEEKDELEKIDESQSNVKKTDTIEKNKKKNNDNKIYVNLKTLDKITAKTSSIKLILGEKKFFGPLEIKVLKCQYSENENIKDTVAYLQVKDLSVKDNDQVFLFNGWMFISSPTLRSIDHPVYDMWITSCENI